MAWEFDNNTALKNDNEPQWELEGTKPVTQSVMDDRDGKIYNVPLAYDGVDTRFAIDTQHKGADKGSFFGKVFMDVAKMTTALTTSDMLSKMLPDEISFEGVKDAARGVVGSFEGFVDNKLVEATDIRRKQRIAAGKTYNAGYGDPLRDMAFDWELPTEEEQAEAKKLVETAQKIRDANKQWWNSAKEAIKPEETMDETDKFIEALSGGATSMAISMGSMLPFKSATVGAALIAAEYGKMAGNQFFDEAVKNGMDFDEAYTAAFGRGGIEAGLELVADTTLAKIGNLKAIQDISNRVISSGLIKAAQSKLGKSAIQKIGTRHTNSVFGAALKGFGSEGGTEALQQSLGMFYDNAAGIADYSLDQILGETLFAAVIGGITGGVGGGGGTMMYNREVVKTNERIKKELQLQTPELTAEETQVMADALQEMLFQESTGYMTELNKVMEKELAPDVRQEGLTPEQLTAETRKLLKEKYKMSDEDINKTIQSALSVIDARNQFNEAYAIFNEGLSNAGRDTARADGEARILAARALSVARAQGTQVKDVLDRWNLQFRQTAWNEGDIDKAASVIVKDVNYNDFVNFVGEEVNPVTEEVFDKIKESVSRNRGNMENVIKELTPDMNALSVSETDLMEVVDYVVEPNEQALLQGRVVDTIKSFFKPVAKDVSNFRNFFRKAIRGELSENTILQISERTPEIYKRLGLDDKPMGIANKTIAKANIGKHNVPLNVLEELPEFIFDPIAVLDSKTSEGSFVAILNAVDDNGDTVVAIIKPTQGKYNIVPSVYGKDDLDNLIKSSNIRYKDIERANIVIRPSSLQLLGVDNTVSSLTKSSMTQNERDVNSLLQQQALFQESLDIANQNAELDANNPAYEGETININGVERTVYNSNGDRIAMSEPALRNFYNWFGDSKVVDEQGRPLVVYHGTSAEFDKFDVKKQGKNDTGFFGRGFYFTPNKKTAEHYAYHKIVMPVYLNIKNPLDLSDLAYKQIHEIGIDKLKELGIYTKEAKDFIENPVEVKKNGKIVKATTTLENYIDEGKLGKKLSDSAKKQGFDGVIVKGKELVTFYPNQIKSTSNRGTFNPEDDRIYFQSAFAGPRGAYRNSIIYLFENADASTVIHELGHFFLDDMQKFADNETTKAQLEAIYKYVGSVDGVLTPEQHEYFANSFELYLLEGRAPNKTLEKVFWNFRKWISRIWSEIKRLSGINLTPEIRKVFDEMLGGRGLDFAMQMSGARMAEALESGTIPPNVIAKAIDLLDAGKMSRADMDDLITRMKTGELKRKDFNQELKKFENSNTKHNERLNPFDKVKYKDMLSKGNFSKKDVMEKINRLLKWTEPRSQNGKVVGRFSNLKMNQEFDHIRELMNMEKAQAKEKLDENIKLINAMIRGEETGDMDRLVFDNKILTIRLNKANASLLLDVYNAISDSYNMGRLTTAVTGEARRARKNRLVNEAVHVLTADGDVDWRKERGKLKQFVNQLGTSQMSWQGILDILSMNDKTSKTGQSLLVQNLDVFDAQQKEAEGLAEDGEKASRFMEKKLKGVGNAAISVSRYVNSKLDEKFTIQWGLNKKTFTKDQLLDIYMKAKDEETKKMMAEDTILQYNDAFLSEVNEILTAEDRAIAEALFEFYDDNYAKINAFYEEKYGTSLGKRAFYSPRSMDRGGVNVDTGDLTSFAGFSSIKERKAKAGAVKIKGAFQVLQDYIVNSNHWIAWSDKLIDINAVMGDVEVKNIIRNLFGEGMEKRIGYEVSRMASNDKFQSKFGYGKLFNKIRSNYAIAALAAKPSLMIKQLTSFPAYWEHMSTAEFMSGLADFAVHMKEAVETLGNTTLMKTRDVNIIKDFEELSKSELFKKNANKVKLRELLMANIKLGDRGAIYMGGWALYKAELKKNLAKGMSEEKAKALALEKFERVTDETQQSGRLSQQSYWQSNPFLRAFTMFQSSQNQYLRKEINAIRGLATGRMDKKQALKTLFIFHVLLPCFFQYASDGFDWDEKAQLRAALLGSLNGIFILNGILERGLDYALGTVDAWKATSTALSDVLPFWGSGEDLAKFFINLAEGDIDLEDYVEVIRAFGKPVGELTGIPVKYPLDVIQNFGEYAEEGEVKKEVLLWLGWSPYALRDKEED